MEQLDCNCQLSAGRGVGARERVLVSALKALEEGVGAVYGPGSQVSARLREVQSQVLEGGEWSLLKVRRGGVRG